MLADLCIVANACQYFFHVHSPEPNCNITLLSKNTKSMQTKASECNKAFLSNSQNRVITVFFFQCSKSLEYLPFNITGLNNFNSFYSQLSKHVFNE